VRMLDNGFVLLHAGTLLGPRQPWSLLEAFRRFLAAGPGRTGRAELKFVGAVNRNLKSDPRWAEAMQIPGVRIFDQRVPYAQSLELLRQASVGIILESESGESPFFPAKLTDCLACRRPVLALSPSESVVSDLLGRDYPYRCGPTDVAGIGSALEHLWGLWREGKLSEAAAPPQLAETLSMATVGAQCRQIFEQCGPRAERAAPRPAMA
jgi:hypothetical protein